MLKPGSYPLGEGIALVIPTPEAGGPPHITALLPVPPLLETLRTEARERYQVHIVCHVWKMQSHGYRIDVTSISRAKKSH